ncbi:ethionine resistance protein [Blastocladiella emersonii ATCC 22665]|nr:ethionine resistance protein [Blastocladiella emersonii ATCC 22665]
MTGDEILASTAAARPVLAANGSPETRPLAAPAATARSPTAHADSALSIHDDDAPDYSSLRHRRHRGGRRPRADSVTSSLTARADDDGERLTKQITVNEMKTMMRLAVPSIGGSMLSFANRMVVTVVVGHLGAAELASSTLAVMYTNVLGYSFTLGLTTALDTLASQAMTGASNPRQAGVFLQRAILINLAMTLPIAVLWLFAEPLLLLVGQEPDLCHLAGSYIRYLLPSLFPSVVANGIAKYLQAQQLMKAQLLVSSVVLPVNAALQYFFVYVDSPFRMGYYGAAAGTCIAEWLSLLLLIAYARFVRGHEAWTPWSRAAVRDWGPFIRLGLGGMVMVISEWWVFELVALVAGLFGAVPLAAQSVILDTTVLLYNLFLGLAVVTSNRVGNLLGAAMPNAARHAAQVSVLLALLVSSVTMTVLLAARTRWANIFTSDPDVVRLVASVLPIVAVFQFADGGVCVLGGILRGCGKQAVGAAFSLVSYYVVGLPLAMVLTFLAGFQLHGTWYALAGTQGLCYVLLLAYVTLRIDWRREVRRALERVNAEDSLDSDDGDDLKHGEQESV